MNIKVCKTKDRQKLFVKSINDNHNHDINQTMYKLLLWQRHLDEDTKKETEQILQLKGNKKMVQEHIQITTGKIVTLKLQHYLFCCKN